MTFTDTQVRQLKAKLDAKHVRTRQANGASLHYVEGWHVIAEANRIFGHDAWDRRTIATTCVWTGASGQYHAAAYTARVRVSVRAGDIIIVREGSGTGEGRTLTPGQAHELALKGAETDATKRALATFGNPFGLALYDREQTGVRKARSGRALSAENPEVDPWVLRSATGVPGASFETSTGFAEALHKAMSEAQDITLLYAIWEQNVETVRAINRRLKQEASPRADIVPKLLAHLKACAIELANVGKNRVGDDLGARRNGDARRFSQNGRAKIDKSVLAIAEPKRHRSKEHLRFVAQQPCLICGRSPTHAHHVRFAQSRGLGLKVSDEFTVPLCAIHHQQNHATGNERQWWQEHKIDPLAVAERLWRESQQSRSGPSSEVCM
jgi:Rad52/22 family double-strand break repair protein